MNTIFVNIIFVHANLRSKQRRMPVAMISVFAECLVYVEVPRTTSCKMISKSCCYQDKHSWIAAA